VNTRDEVSCFEGEVVELVEALRLQLLLSTLLHFLFPIQSPFLVLTITLLICPYTSYSILQYDGTALHEAACYHHPEMCKVLIDAGADVNSQNRVSPFCC
jgi:ankyrin repeat protein